MTTGSNGMEARPALSDPWQAQLQLPSLCDIPSGPGAVCQLGKAGSQAAGDAAKSAFDDVIDTLIDGVAKFLRVVMTWWLNLPSPQLAANTGEPGPVLGSIRDYTSGLQVLLMTGGIMFAAARLALAKRGGVAGEAQESFLVFGKAVFASMMFAAVITAGTRAGDQFSKWVIFDATRGDLTSAVSRFADFDLKHNSGLGSGALLILAILGTISMLVQLVMLVVRQALLILVVAAIPIAAAAAGTGPGSQAYKKMLTWALAFVLWKPVGALVYAIAFTAAGTKDGGQQQDSQLVLLGLLLLLMVPIVLPALMRLIAPAVATLGGGGGAAAALAGAGLGAAMSSAGRSRGEARPVSERESSPGGGGSPSAPDEGGGGGRPMPDGGGGGVAGGGARAGDGGGGGAAGSGGASAPAETSGAKAPGGGSEAASSGGAAGAGVAGAAVMVAKAGAGVARQGVSAVDATATDAADGGFDLDAPVSGEVRR
ncbi:hypothetical protein [Nocardia sp. NPDC052112]|uniref:hypothetical protein n=1 Tax=Nocardia sp. NPDC052112 TaxID=3155646 RepID=UPI003416C304